MGIIKYDNKIKEEGSDLAKLYNYGLTDKNKLKYATTMGENHPGRPPLVTRRIPTEPETNPSPEPRGPLGRRLDDVSRIAQLFVRREGLNFATNNLILNTASAQSYRQPSTLKDKTKALSGANALNALLDTTLLIGSTLAQVAVAGTGTHFVRSFGDRYFVSKKQSNATFLQGNPGSVSVRYKTSQPYGPSDNLTIDTVNNLAPTSEPPIVYQDYIKFFFEVLEPQDINGDDQFDRVLLYFRAYLENFSDSFNGTWNGHNYIGRGETFYTYQNFSREISFSFKVAAATKKELMPIYDKLRHLAGTTAPSYSDGGFMRGTFIKATIGDYIWKMPGFISNITYSWNKDYPWEIAYYKDHEGKEIAGTDPNENTDLTVNQLPTVLDVAISFTPVHRFVPQSLSLNSSEDSFDGRNLHYISKPVGIVEADRGEFGQYGTDGELV